MSRDLPHVLLRRPTVSEIDALAALHAWSWRVTYGPLLSEDERRLLTVEERRRLWQRVLLEPAERETAWVAELDGRVAGMVLAGPNHDDDADLAGAALSGEVHAIHVEPGLHGLGIGGLLLAAAEADLVANGFARARLWVILDNHEARRFYEGRGWRPDGRTKHAPMGDFDGLPIVDEMRYAKVLER